MNAQSGNVPNVATSMRGGMCCGAKSAKMIKAMAPHWLNYVETGSVESVTRTTLQEGQRATNALNRRGYGGKETGFTTVPTTNTILVMYNISFVDPKLC